jgi:hypothetical protein
MLNGRLYRAALLPVGLALAIAAFSLGSRPRPLTSTLAPDAFEGARAFADLQALAAQFPHRRPGSPGDEALAAHVAHAIKALGGAAGGGFSVRLHRFEGDTAGGERTLTTVVAQRPGATNLAPIAVLAHRDASGAGARAELSGTAALLELARVFAARETQRTIVLVSSSGGSAGGAGAIDFAAHADGAFDAAIVLGDVASARQRQPVVVPYSDGLGSAPLQLQRTVAGAIRRETGSEPAEPSVLGELAHLAFPLAVGEQGPLDQRGVPAVLIQASGERGPSGGQAVSAERLQSLGRAALSSIDAIDRTTDISTARNTSVLVQRKTFPGWALRLLVVALLLPALIVIVDGLARQRRRRLPVARWLRWTLACALPFLAVALFLRLLGAAGVIAAPGAPVAPEGLGIGGAALRALAAAGLALALAWLVWPALMRSLRLPARPDPDVAGPAILLVLVAVCLVAAVTNPFAALLALPAAHVWLALASPQLRPRRVAGALSLFAIGLAPVVLLAAFYAHELGLGPGRFAWMGVLLVSGGHVGLFELLLWSLAAGCAVGAGLLAASRPLPPAPGRPQGPERITIRGPLSYAGPGSLGGTESALRR